ncbi:MAG TPA: GNAT family N-acetyltransferase [Rhizomicrobium sp.]|jgi:RimJ/RimL family protein N-acetyltransferase
MIETKRLRLRPWTEADVPEFMRVTNTPAVMEFLGGVQPADSFEGAFHRVSASQSENGFCFWIVERLSDHALLGFCGLKRGNVGPVVGEIEIGWRLCADAWGQGYAFEAASASLDWAWRNLTCARVVAVTAQGNKRSWRLMEKLGMHRMHGLDFEHPDVPADNPLRLHITYAIDRPGTNPTS